MTNTSLLKSYTGLDGDRHSATLSKGQPGVLHGVRTYILQSDKGQIIETHSISAGLDYPGVGPEHAWLKDSGRAEYLVATDEEALRGFRLLTQREGIIPGKSFCCPIFHGRRVLSMRLQHWNHLMQSGKQFKSQKLCQRSRTLLSYVLCHLFHWLYINQFSCPVPVWKRRQGC